MLKRQELETEKYVQQELKRWALDVKAQRNRKAISDFVTFLFGLLLIALGVLIVGTFEHWSVWFEQLMRPS